jgi:hypothetical protein
MDDDDGDGDDDDDEEISRILKIIGKNINGLAT